MTASDLPPSASEDRPHKPADDREEVYFSGSPLMRGEVGVLFLFALVGALIFFAPFIWKAMFGNYWPWWLFLLCFVVGALVFVIPWVMTKTLKFRISNYRIDVEKGLLWKSIDTLELWHVEDIKLAQGPLDRILGVGTITVISRDDTTPELALKSLPNPRPLFDSLKQRVIAVKRQRGVIKMDVG